MGKGNKKDSPAVIDEMLTRAYSGDDTEVPEDAIEILESAKTEKEIDEIIEALETEEEPNKSDDKGSDEKPEEKEGQGEGSEDKAPDKGDGSDTQGKDDETEPPEESPEKSDKDDDSDKGEETESEVFVIDDEFIESWEEDADKKILEKLKGIKIDEKGLKMLINAERMVGKKAQSQPEPPIAGEKEPEIDPENPLPKNVPPQPEVKSPELQKKIEEETLNALRQKPEFKDAPTDPEDFKDWLRDLNADDPERFYRFISERDKVRSELEQTVNQAVYIQKHAVEVNNALLQKEVNDIMKEFEEYGIDPSQVQGFDFTLTPDERTGILRNQILEELMLDENGQIDPRVVSVIGKAKVLNKGALKAKFIEKYGKAIIKQAINSGLSQAKADNFKRREEKKRKTLKSAAQSGSSKSSIKSFEEIIEKGDVSDIDKIIKEIEASAGIT